MIKQALVLIISGFALTGCVVAPFDDGPRYSSSSYYGSGYHNPQWNNGVGHHRPKPPSKPIKPPHVKPPQQKPSHPGQKPPSFRPPQQVKPHVNQTKPAPNKPVKPQPVAHKPKPQSVKPMNAPRLPQAQRPLRPSI